LQTPLTPPPPRSLHDALPICDLVDAAEARVLPDEVERAARLVDRDLVKPALGADVPPGVGIEGDPLTTRPDLLRVLRPRHALVRDRKSTRLNSSHEWISYAVF